MDPRRGKRHPISKKEIVNSAYGRAHDYGMLDNGDVDCRGLPSRSDHQSADRGTLASVTEESASDELGAANSSTTLAALTTKHLMATTDARLSYHRTQDLSSYKSLCEKQRKSSSKVPSPYHTASLMGQWGKPQSKSSEPGTVDTGYKSTFNSSCDGNSAEVYLAHQKCFETNAMTRHFERVRERGSGFLSQRIPTKNPRPLAPDTDTLAAVLIEKLQQVQRERDVYRSREDLERDEAQSILDDHISRVWGDSSGELSPREKVSSWVLDTKKYCDIHSNDGKSTRMEVSYDEDERRCRLGTSNHLGSIDEGLGQSINSLATSRSELGRSYSTISSRQSLPQFDNTKRFVQSSQNATSRHEASRSSCSTDQDRLRVNKKPSHLCPSNDTSVRETISVIYQINGESLPYLSKVSGTELSLRQFKSLIPRKGKYRYFFKRTCDDLSIGAVFEEITDDNEVLPFWEGKISARLEATD